MNWNGTVLFLPVAGALLLLAACQTRSYAPPPRLAEVESVEISVSRFHDRPEARARIRGRLSTSAARLIDVKQSREGRVLHLEVREQTPRGADLTPDLVASPSFDTVVPLELIGLLPGTYLVAANGAQASFELPADLTVLPEDPRGRVRGTPPAEGIVSGDLDPDTAAPRS